MNDNIIKLLNLEDSDLIVDGPVISKDVKHSHLQSNYNQHSALYAALKCTLKAFIPAQ